MGGVKVHYITEDGTVLEDWTNIHENAPAGTDYTTEQKDFDGYEFVDLRELFNEFVESKGIEKFRKQFQNMGTEVFVSQNYSEGTFYTFLMKRIAEVGEKGISPILIHTGTIYKMGFSNQNIMEDPSVMKFQKPLVFFYPATVRNDTIYFLDKQPASKYRCVVII